MARIQAPDALSDGVRQAGQLSTRRRLHPAKSGARSSCAINVDTIKKEHVKMKIEVQRTSEPLDQRDRASAGYCAGIPRLTSQVRGNAAVNDAEHVAHDCWTAGKQKTQWIRKAQHPLTYWLFGKDLVHQQRRTLSHVA